MSHVPFRHPKQLDISGADTVLVDYDESTGQYVAFFAQKVQCDVKGSASFASKGDLNSYMKTFCAGQDMHYGRIRFVMRVGKRIVHSKEYSLSGWNKTTARLDFQDECAKEHPRSYQSPHRSIESEYKL